MESFARESTWRAGSVVAVLVGTFALVALSLHGSVWFDEAYSLSLVTRPLGELLSIASSDVHPPLYYLALRAVWLLSAGSLTACRLFSATGLVATAALGLGSIRRDFGARTAFYFICLVLFSPFNLGIALQVRMYSWCAFAVTVCFVYALRIVRDDGWKCSTWVTFALSSLAAAYLHYFGMLAAFLINAWVLWSIVRSGMARERIAAFAVSAVAQLAAYAPWLYAMVGQVGRVSGGFWISLSPQSVLQALVYPLLGNWTAQGVDAVLGLADGGGVESLYVGVPGGAATPLAFVAGLLVLAVLAAFAVCTIAACPRALRGFALYGAVAVFALLFSAMVTPILYYRYLFCVYGPFALSCAMGLDCMGRMMPDAAGGSAALRAHGALLCRAAACAFVALTVLNAAFGMPALVHDLYAPENHALTDALEARGRTVLLDDATTLGAFAWQCPDLSVVFKDVWGNAAAYRAFEGANMRMVSNDAWDDEPLFGSYTFVFRTVGSDCEAWHQRALKKSRRKASGLLSGRSFNVEDEEAVYVPYEGAWYTLVDVKVMK